jgi:methyltransferase (TIGR00027 family)
MMEEIGKLENSLSDDIAETLYITLNMKAKESERKNSLLNDPIASKLVESIDYDFSKFDNAIKSLIGVAIRSSYFDDCVRSHIFGSGNPVVVLIGCGLDARYHRINDVSEKGFFYELDIPEVIRLREQLIPPEYNEGYIPKSMLDYSWMDELKDKHPNGDFIFVIEGVLMYFDENNVRDFFTNLSNRFNDSEIYFDVVNVWLSKNSHLHDTVKQTNASFKWGLDDDKALETWNNKLQHISTKLYCDFKEWNKVGIQAQIMKLLPFLKYGGRLLHYHIN